MPASGRTMSVSAPYLPGKPRNRVPNANYARCGIGDGPEWLGYRTQNVTGSIPVIPVRGCSSVVEHLPNPDRDNMPVPLYLTPGNGR